MSDLTSDKLILTKAAKGQIQTLHVAATASTMSALGVADQGDAAKACGQSHFAPCGYEISYLPSVSICASPKWEMPPFKTRSTPLIITSKEAFNVLFLHHISNLGLSEITGVLGFLCNISGFGAVQLGCLWWMDGFGLIRPAQQSRRYCRSAL